MALDPNDIPSLHNNPMFLWEQNKRYEHVSELANQISKIDKLINRYCQLGEQICETVKESVNTLNGIEFVCTNRHSTTTMQLMNEFQNALHLHFNDVKELFSESIRDFLKNKFHNLQESKKAFSKNLEKYYASQDHYLSIPKRSKPKVIEEKKMEYKRSFNDSVQSLFDYLSKLEHVEKCEHDLIRSYMIRFPCSFLQFTKKIFKKIEKEASKADESQDICTIPLNPHLKKTKSFQGNISKVIPQFLENLDMRPNPNKNLLTKQGFLWKKNKTFGKSWEKYYFVCSQGLLSYSTTVENAHNPSKTISLDLASVVPNENEDRLYVFNIRKQSTIISLQAPTMYDYEEWINVIQNGIIARLTNGHVKDLSSITTNGTPGDLNQCADCGCANSDWYLINRGLIICKNCAGIHRSLPNVSTVRSLTLDDIDKYDLKIRSLLQNNALNNYLEYQEADDKISPDSSPQERNSFIVHKYVDKLYINPSYVLPDVFEVIKNQDLLELMKIAFMDKLNVSLEGGFKPIHAAACIGNPVILVAIIRNSTQINDLDDNGWSAFSYAAYYNNPVIIDVLLDFKGNIFESVHAHPYIIAKELNNNDLLEKLDIFAVNYKKEQLPPLTPINKDFTPQPIKEEMIVQEDSGEEVETSELSKDERRQIKNAMRNMTKKRKFKRRSISSSFDARYFAGIED